jgi:hypothetical protein
MFEKIFQSIKSFSNWAVGLLPQFNYQPNDPATPGLVERVSVPPLPNPCPTFAVYGWNGVEAPDGTIEAQAAQVYITIATSLNQVNRLLDLPIGNWSGTNNLVAFPRAGKQFNAYYDRLSLKFFYDVNPSNNKTVYTCESADIVSHELGHGLLDSLRPDIWGVQALEIFAYHESFGDINAILTGLFHDEIINYVIRETNGDLKNSNIISRLAEEMGGAIYAATHGAGGRKSDALRNAVNSFVYSPPESLPFQGPDDQLCGEPHSFSRVFTGAFYDLLVNIYQQNVQTMSPVDALRSSRDMSGRIIYNASRIAATNSRYFNSMARAMLTISQNYGENYRKAVYDVFSNRKIYTDIPMLAPSPLKSTIFSKETKIHNLEFGSIVKIGGTKGVKMVDHFGDTTNPLYMVEVTIPDEYHLEYDRVGKLTTEIPADKTLAVQSAKHCLDFLWGTNSVSLDKDNEDKEFKVVNNKLVRNYICRNDLSHRISSEKQ